MCYVQQGAGTTYLPHTTYALTRESRRREWESGRSRSGGLVGASAQWLTPKSLPQRTPYTAQSVHRIRYTHHNTRTARADLTGYRIQDTVYHIYDSPL